MGIEAEDAFQPGDLMPDDGLYENCTGQRNLKVLWEVFVPEVN